MTEKRKSLWKKLIGDQRVWNGRAPYGRYNSHLTSRLSVPITPEMEEAIGKIIERHLFPNKAEFIRYLIHNYLGGFERAKKRRIK